MTTINKRIEVLIENLGITKTAFAEKLNVTQPYISKLIKTGVPSDRLVEDICQKFNVNEEWLQDGDGDMYIEENDTVKLAAILLGKKDPKFEALIQTYSQLNDENKKLFVKLGMTLLEDHKEKKE